MSGLTKLAASFDARQAMQKMAEALTDGNEPNTFGNAALGVGGLTAVGASKNLILGKKRVYHGTSQDQWNQIKSEGLLASRGGTGASQGVGIPGYVDASQDKIHVTRFAPVANMYANLAGKGSEEMQNYSKKVTPQQMLRVTNPEGHRIKMDMDYNNWKRMAIDNVGSDDVSDIPRLFHPLAKQMAAKGPVDITPAEIHGSNATFADRAGHTLSKLPGYIAAHPGRFTGGLALAGLGGMAAAHAVHNMVHPGDFAADRDNLLKAAASLPDKTSMKVFLGGTTGKSKWREELIPLLDIDYYNPVVKNWTPKRQEEEKIQRETCDLVLYVITKDMEGVYSIAEVTDDSNKRPDRTIFCVLEDGFDEGELKSLRATKDMVANNGGQVFKSLAAVAKYINAQVKGSEEPQEHKAGYWRGEREKMEKMAKNFENLEEHFQRELRNRRMSYEKLQSLADKVRSKYNLKSAFLPQAMHGSSFFEFPGEKAGFRGEPGRIVSVPVEEIALHEMGHAYDYEQNPKLYTALIFTRKSLKKLLPNTKWGGVAIPPAAEIVDGGDTQLKVAPLAAIAGGGAVGFGIGKLHENAEDRANRFVKQHWADELGSTEAAKKKFQESILPLGRSSYRTMPFVKQGIRNAALGALFGAMMAGGIHNVRKELREK